MDFSVFKNAISKQFQEMSQASLYVTDTTKDDIWNTYLSSFPEGSDPIFRERTEHDCQCCKQFIRQIGNVVTINYDGTSSDAKDILTSIWDINIGGPYQKVADKMSAYVKSKEIRNFLLKSEQRIGVDKNISINESGNTETFQHFCLHLPSNVITHKDKIGEKLSDYRSSYDVFYRGLRTISLDAIDTVLELIAQNSLYRGEEHLMAVKGFKTLLTNYEETEFLPLTIYSWMYCLAPGARIRNTVIGTLLVDLSEGVDIETAVGKYEAKVAPENYKRPKALITKGMIDKAQKKVEELNLQDSLFRRFAIINDITINNVLFADRSAKKAMNVFDELKDAVPDKPKSLEHVEKITIKDFMQNVLPSVNEIEIMFEPNHVNNLVSLIAPENSATPPITKWHNNFTWTYNGELADSTIRDKVKAMGGGTVGPLRFSINWAEGEWESDNSDLDAWASEPGNTRIGFNTDFVAKYRQRSPCSGQLDIDIINPNDYHHKNIVENIIWTNKTKMKDGKYLLWVNPYSARNSLGFNAEIEINNQVYTYQYNQPVRQNINVAEVTLLDGVFSIKHHLPALEATPQKHWNISTLKFHKVQTIMYSPNHWDNKGVGNRHYFFMIEECKNPDNARGFFNEFLPESLTPHRKVFETLGSKMRAKYSDQQLSGLGFSTTKKSSVYLRVTGSFSRILQVMF